MATTKMTARWLARPTFHRDHTVTLWDVFKQQRVRYWRVPDAVLATFDPPLRKRIANHVADFQPPAEFP